MKISYAITVCNELTEVGRLLDLLLANKREQDEICVLLDKPKASPALIDQLYRYSSADRILLKESTFQGHFADWKNELTAMCSGDYIFQIDADEYPHIEFVNFLPTLIEANPDIEVYLVPRINTVDGLTDLHIQKWGWNVNSEGWVNWPDYQWRIYKNVPNIKWKNKVHEVLEGFKQYAHLPMEEDYSLYHPKLICRQEQQNEYYNTL